MKTIGAFSRDVLARLGVWPEERAVLEDLWRRHIQPPLSAHVRPLRYVQGMLRVQADSPVWASRLRHYEQELLGRLRFEPYFKDLRTIRVRVNPSPGILPVGRPRPARRPNRLSADSARAIRGMADGIADPALRTALERLAANFAGSEVGHRDSAGPEVAPCVDVRGVSGKAFKRHEGQGRGGSQGGGEHK